MSPDQNIFVLNISYNKLSHTVVSRSGSVVTPEFNH